MNLSVVATLYQSTSHIDEFHRRASAAARQLAGDSFEIILVNDGSPDDSLDRAIELTESDDHVVLVDLSRNFGHHKAMMTGLAHARGQKVFLIDIDLEEEPEWLLPFAAQMATEACDVVYGRQSRRRGGLVERLSGRWFYRFFRTLTGLALPENAVTARLMSRRYVDALLRHEERELFLAGIWHITGFVQQPYTVEKHSSSTTTYTLSRKISLLVNSVTSFSNAPLISIFYVGATISLLATAYIVYLIINGCFWPAPHRLDVRHSVDLVAWRLDYLLHRCDRYLSCEDVLRDQAPPLHHRQADLWQAARLTSRISTREIHEESLAEAWIDLLPIRSRTLDAIPRRCSHRRVSGRRLVQDLFQLAGCIESKLHGLSGHRHPRAEQASGSVAEPGAFTGRAGGVR